MHGATNGLAGFFKPTFSVGAPFLPGGQAIPLYNRSGKGKGNGVSGYEVGWLNGRKVRYLSKSTYSKG
jgi:hypothetical protein